MKNPIQPLSDDGTGTIRFKSNEIVDYILENGGIDLNHLAHKKWSRTDQEQFAQLIGYSLGGFGELSYVSDETYETAERMAKDTTISELQARCKYLQETLDEVRKGLKVVVPAVFRVHPEDLIV